MDEYKKKHVSDIRVNISRLKKIQQRHEDTLKNIIRLNLSPEILSMKQDEIRSNIESINEEIYNLEEREREFVSGRNDDEVIKEVEKSRNRKVKIKVKVTTKPVQFKKRFREDDNRFMEKEYDYYYKQFWKAIDTLPEYMRDNLREMPNNKGYIWRECWFYGEKPSEVRQPTIMFEKARGGVLKIHELSSEGYKIFEKIGRDRKRLISFVGKKRY